MGEAMTTELSTQRASLITKVATHYGVEPNKMLDTLKATAFRTEKPISNEQMMSLLIVADQHGLNPFTRELFAYPDKGGIVPVVSVDGWARIINEHPQFDGIAFEFTDDGSACACTIFRKDRAHPIVVVEYMAECKRGTQPWNSHPRRMLRHKSMIQCARIAFGFAGIFDPDEAERIAQAEAAPSPGIEAVRAAIAPARKARAPQRQAELIDVETGEITDVPAEPEPPAPSYAEFVEMVKSAADADVASLILDEARSTLPEDQVAELGNVFTRAWP